MTITINASTSSGLITTPDNSGDIALQSSGATKLTVSSSGTYGQLVSGTAVATTSGTSVDITGIPSWVKRVTLVLSGVSTNSSNTFLVQVGAGSIVTTGYKTVAGRIFDSSAVAVTNTSSIAFWGVVSSSSEHFGNVVLTTVGSNIWVSSFCIGQGTNALAAYGGGGVTLSGALDRVRLTTTGGDTFDAGSFNILYEG
jgi:hypothetical protein